MASTRSASWPIALLLVLGVSGACSIGQPPIGETAASPAVTTVIVARNLAFDRAVIRLPRDVPVGATLDNRDPGILHNVAIIDSDGTAVFRGATFAGIEARTYRVAPLREGEYRFVCDVHPSMTGTVVVG